MGEQGGATAAQAARRSSSRVVGGRSRVVRGQSLAGGTYQLAAALLSPIVVTLVRAVEGASHHGDALKLEGLKCLEDIMVLWCVLCLRFFCRERVVVHLEFKS